VKDKIRWLATGIVPGTSERFQCPICNGGSTQEETLVVTVERNGIVKFMCHRANCGKRGIVYLGAHSMHPHSAKVLPEPRIYTKPTVILTDDQVDLFKRTFGLDTKHCGLIRYSPETNRYVLPIRDPGHNLRGYLARSLTGDSPKSLTYNAAPEEPFLGWFFPEGDRRADTATIIVEDWFSAAKCAMAGFVAVTLSGTNISHQAAWEIGDTGGHRVILALDKGMMPQMMKLKAKYDGVWDYIQIWDLERDLKYEELERIVDARKSGKAFIGRSDHESSLL
jgi:hypothetical protein